MLEKAWTMTKRFFGILLILFVLSIVSLIFFILTFDLNRYKDLAAAKLTLILDHPVKIESMHTKLALIPTITVTGFEILNKAPFQDKAPLISIQKLDAELELAPLLNSQLNIHQIDVDTATINLFKDKEGNNWSLAKKTVQDQKDGAKEESTPKSLKKKDLQKNIRLNVVTINELKVNYDDSKIKQTLTINKLEMKYLHMLTGDIAYKNQTFHFNLNAGVIFDMLNQVPNYPFDLKVTSRLINFSLNGKIGDFAKLTGLQGVLSVRTGNIKNMMEFFKIQNALIPTQNAQLQVQVMGDIDNLDIKQASFNINSDKDLSISGTGTLKDVLKNPILSINIKGQLFNNKLAEELKLSPMTLTGDFTVSPTTFKTKMLSLDANRSDVHVSANLVRKNDKINVTANVTSEFFYLYDFIKKDQNKASQPEQLSARAKHKQVSAQKQDSGLIPWNKLNDVNISLNVNFQNMPISDWLTDYIGFTSHATLHDGTFKVPFDIRALTGKITGNLTGNTKGQTVALSVAGSDLNLNGLRLVNQEVKDLVLQMELTANARGNDIKKMLGTLNGTLVAETNRGQIINRWFANLPKMLALNKKKQNVAFSHSDSKIMISCAAVNLTMKNGVISGKDQVALETNILNVMAGGTINLPQQTMDILLKPSLADGTADELLSLSKYIRIAGPFDKLTPRVDTDEVAVNLIRAGLSKLAGAAEQNISTVLPVGGMCQNVLGKNALIKKGQGKSASKTVATAPTAPVKQTTQQQGTAAHPFEQQLFDSLFQALSPQ